MQSKYLELHYADIERAEEQARALIPAHLDADELVANPWINAADIDDKGIYESVEENMFACFHATVDLYIDQDCSSF